MDHGALIFVGSHSAHTCDMTSALETISQLPPVTVDCNWCDTQFLSRAKHMVSVHCPRCGHSARVKRWQRQQPPQAPIGPPAPSIVPTPPTGADSPAVPVGVGNVGEAAAEELGEGEETYIYDEAGCLVLAEWTPDGQLVKVRLSGSQLAAELSARGYQVNSSAQPGGCHITETRPTTQDCGLAASASVASVRVCTQHEHALTACLRIGAR